MHACALEGFDLVGSGKKTFVNGKKTCAFGNFICTGSQDCNVFSYIVATLQRDGNTI